MNINEKLTESDVIEIENNAEEIFEGAIYRGKFLVNPIPAYIILMKDNRLIVVTKDKGEPIVERLIPYEKIKRVTDGQGTATLPVRGEKPLNLLISSSERIKFLSGFGKRAVDTSGALNIPDKNINSMDKFKYILSKANIKVNKGMASKFDTFAALMVVLVICLTPVFKLLTPVLVFGILAIVYIKNNYF